MRIHLLIRFINKWYFPRSFGMILSGVKDFNGRGMKMGYTKEIEKVLFLLQKGYECENSHHDWRTACEYYGEARNCLGSIYGEGSKLCNIVSLYDYVQESYQGNYRAAALMLADAGELLDNFSESDIVDDFTEWIHENRQLLLDEAVAKTWDVFYHFDFDFSLENVLIQSMFAGNDEEELMNRTFIDPLGLPRKFHFFLQQISKYNKNVTPDMKHKAAELYTFLRDYERKDFSDMSNEEKAHFAKSAFGVLQDGFQSFKGNEILGNGLSSFIGAKQKTVMFDMVRGMMGLGETEFADTLFTKLKGDLDVSDIDWQIKIKLVECLLEEKKGNRVKAEEILDKITEMENDIIMKIFFMKEERKKIEILKGIEYLMKRTAEVCGQIRGSEAAYSIVVRTRTLSFDHANIHLSSDEHKHVISKIQQLKLREKAGEDMTEEYSRINSYFENISHGIFDFDPMKICRKLTDRQAILEFTVMTDDCDSDFYYVFVVTSKKIMSINLGKCEEINEYIGGVLEYIGNYAANKYSSCQIRALAEYRQLYEKVLLPISEVLPQTIHTLFIAGAGDFLRLPFGMLPCFHWYDMFMEDEYHINYINSGKEILRDANGIVNKGAVVIGNPDFNGKFPALPSSETEAEAVAKLLNVDPVIGRDAVPGCLKKPAGIFHISTHSCSREEAGLEKEMDPMKNVNLVFADGELLSAKEICSLDMSKTDLVVLSVCGIKEENGVNGDVGPGIRRAFINAGARHIILNFWKTDDHAAALLMKNFYDCYLNKQMNIENALREAKHCLRASSVGEIKKGKYYDEGMEEVFALMKEDEIPYGHPYYWAGFISFGA